LKRLELKLEQKMPKLRRLEKARAEARVEDAQAFKLE